jgi:hypothetical protein
MIRIKRLSLVLMIAAIVSTPATAQTTSISTGDTVTYVEPPDDIYVDLILAATGWARKSIAKSVGVVQREDASGVWQRAIAAAAKEHDLKVIPLADYTMVCFTRQATRATSMSRSCSMKGAEAVLQFTSVRVSGDSGFVGTSVTRVPRGGQKPESSRYCIALGRKGTAWETARGDTTFDRLRCPRD